MPEERVGCSTRSIRRFCSTARRRFHLALRQQMCSVAKDQLLEDCLLQLPRRNPGSGFAPSQATDHAPSGQDDDPISQLVDVTCSAPIGGLPDPITCRLNEWHLDCYGGIERRFSRRVCKREDKRYECQQRTMRSPTCFKGKIEEHDSRLFSFIAHNRTTHLTRALISFALANNPEK